MEKKIETIVFENCNAKKTMYRWHIQGYTGDRRPILVLVFSAAFSGNNFFDIECKDLFTTIGKRF